MTRLETWTSASDGLRRRARTTRIYGAQPPSPISDFIHPGVMYTQDQLDYVKTQLAAGAEPHTSAYNTFISKTAVAGNNAASSGTVTTSRKYSDLAWVANPHTTIKRASGPENPNDYDLVDDLKAALTHALIWSYKGTRANANKAIDILNAWATTITQIIYDASTSPGGKLIAGWTGTLLARAAEIMRYTYTPGSGDSVLNVTAIRSVMLNVWWPMVSVGHSGPAVNWYMSFADSMMQIATFLGDRSKFNYAAQYLRQVLPGVAYLTTDNNPYAWAHPSNNQITYANGDVLACPNGLPMIAKSVFEPDHNIYDKSTTSPQTFMETSQAWYHPVSLPNGLWGEVGRDFHHSGMGFAALGNAMETAYKQGLDLYTEFQPRIVPAIELFTSWVYQTYISPVTTTPTNWAFTKASTASSAASNTQRATMELLWHHYIGRKALSMPNLDAYIKNYARPSTYTVDLMIMAEKLTSYGTA